MSLCDMSSWQASTNPKQAQDRQSRVRPDPAQRLSIKLLVGNPTERDPTQTTDRWYPKLSMSIVRCTSRTFTYAKELISVYVCYS